jgi:hypothetical protein
VREIGRWLARPVGEGDGREVSGPTGLNEKENGKKIFPFMIKDSCEGFKERRKRIFQFLFGGKR